MLKEVTKQTEAAISCADALEKASSGSSTAKTRSAQSKLRSAVDALEGLVPAETWPVPSYAEMLFMF